MISRINCYSIKERISRIACYYIKAKGYIGLLQSISLFIAMLAPAIAPEIGIEFIVFLAMVAIILSVLLVFELPRSEVDFVFSTPADPRFIFLGRFMAEWLVYLLLFSMFFFTLPILLQRPTDLPLFIVSIAVSAAIPAVFFQVLSFLGFEKSARLAMPIAAALLALLVYRIPTLMAIVTLIVTLVFLPLREYYTREFYTNAYGLLEELPPPPKPMPRSLWELAWRTTFIIVGRKETLAISVFFAAAYLLIAICYPQWLADATTVSAFFLLVLMSASHLLSPSLERLWISFSADHYAYVRWRTVARSSASLLATSPWIFAYALASLRYPPAAYAAALLASASLVFPVLAWLIVALLGVPQIRRRGLPQRPARYQLLLFLPLAVIVILYLHFWPYIAAFFAVFFLIALFTRLGKGLWDRLVYRLAEVGYV